MSNMLKVRYSPENYSYYVQRGDEVVFPTKKEAEAYIEAQLKNHQRVGDVVNVVCEVDTTKDGVKIGGVLYQEYVAD